MTYPVHVDISSPASFDRTQLALRMLLAIVLGWIGITVGWLVCLLYGALPVLAAIGISSRGGERYVTEDGPRIWRVLAWLLEVSAFMLLLTDRFPTGQTSARIELRPTGHPSVGSALWRLVTSIPSALVLGVLWFVSGILWVVAAVQILIHERVSRSIVGFQRAVLRWNARLVAYHASLVYEYPPFVVDDDDEHHTTLAASGAP